MKRQHFRKAIKAVISYMIILAMLFSVASPFIVQAREIAALEEIQQQKWLDILAADLSGDDISDFTDIFGSDDNNTIAEVIPKGILLAFSSKVSFLSFPTGLKNRLRFVISIYLF